ncbi:Hsp70 family protein [Sulfitobacter aestuarii]|uniref:Hsp70 family protein n=1 Tax=Sulfitobacter aestuarii TaxID=2161676 RepID=A0ABW5U6L9_9RHOB
MANSAALAIDFGTSNSAAGFVQHTEARLIGIETDAQTMPTALFFDAEERRVVYGRAAQEALIGGDDGRYMRALKSLLGTSLMRESRLLLGQRLDFIAIIGRFLAEVKSRAEAVSGLRFERALSGRPVLFHSADPTRNSQALVDLQECYHAAGFNDVRFMAEPEAAARANRDALAPGDLGLIVDIGGGTSDFTLFRQEGAADIEILASHGLRLGGTDFDRELSLSQVMPHLGMGSEVRHMFGSHTHTAPNGIFSDLATWQKIPFLYTRESRRLAQDLARHAVEPEKLGLLLRALEEELGHDIAFAVEDAKIAANDRQASAPPEIRLDMLERGLRLPLPAALMGATLAEMAARIAAAARATVEQAGREPEEVSKLIFVGGSSLMSVVDMAMHRAFPQAEAHRGAALTAIADGLTLASVSAFD